MSKSEEFGNSIKLLDHSELIDLWERIIEGSSLEEWQKGIALEYLILRAFEINGAEVVYPYGIWKEGIQLEQIDGVVYYKHISCLVECKNQDEKYPVDFSPLAKMRSQLLRRSSSAIGSIFSVSGFTGPTAYLARYMAPQTILLWEGSEIEYVLYNNKICDSLVKKYKKYIEACEPDYNTKNDMI